MFRWCARFSVYFPNDIAGKIAKENCALSAQKPIAPHNIAMSVSVEMNQFENVYVTSKCGSVLVCVCARVS